jgi:outer membrane receptor for ferrienterochelin and colicin
MLLGAGLVRPSAWSVLRGIFTLVIFSLLTLSTSTGVLGQDTRTPPNFTDMSLEELMSLSVDTVHGVSGFKQKVTEAPASVTIITSEEIQKYGYRTLADILRNVPGFQVSYDRNYSYLGVRGFGPPGQYNNSIALLIDGHRLNDNIFDSALIGTEFPLDIDLIDRVEIIRGPNSSLYVASAFLGVINIVTKRGQDLAAISVAGDVASYGTYQGRISYGNRLKNGLELLLSGSFYDSHGQGRFRQYRIAEYSRFDFTLAKSLSDGLEGTISYSFQDLTNTTTRMAVINAPKHLVQASLSVPVIKQNVFASMNLQYVSSRATLTGQYSGSYIVPKFTVFTRNILDRWEISASLYNTFNQKYADPAGNGLAENVLFQDGRTFRIKVGYKFQ